MIDRINKNDRSRNMSAIKGRDTTPELFVRKELLKQGFRYRLNVKTLPGKPDIVIRKYKIIIFVNGCFWHGHNCKKGKRPASNNQFWNKKIDSNIYRDSLNIEQLKNLGWSVKLIWTCDLKSQTERVVAEMLQLRASIAKKSPQNKKD